MNTAEKYCDRYIFFMPEQRLISRCKKKLVNHPIKHTKDGVTKTMTYAEFYKQNGRGKNKS